LRVGFCSVVSSIEAGWYVEASPTVHFTLVFRSKLEGIESETAIDIEWTKCIDC